MTRDVEAKGHSGVLKERKEKKLNPVAFTWIGTKRILSLNDTCCTRVVITVLPFAFLAIDRHFAVVSLRLVCSFAIQICENLFCIARLTNSFAGWDV